MEDIDYNLSLEILEKDIWSEPNYDSYLVTRCHALRKIPLNQFTVEDLRILIGQNFSINYLIPIAIEHLEDNPWCRGDFYDGDLLQNVLRINSEYWKHHEDLFYRLSEIMVRVFSQIETFEKGLLPAWKNLNK
ncbi:MAG: contact-dependent growth inhibition system immunity protein [Oscillospiraceae bacterium]|nr:contact-dependent growth inhibition system immunity protein [Oscillospiraceae bacterium]